ncbi:MAG: cyclin-dependent kinase inhibitor 3 family protein [Gammaproteobacteria bacterium]|nr:cyclin-dependent kinase inhibitor 3 family protein [Gammaproteobacteria bacterium]
MSLCPGRRHPEQVAGEWYRDLDADLLAIRTWGARLVVTLLEENELEFFGVGALPERLYALGIEWLHLPIEDMCAPDARFERAWQSAGPQIHAALAAGERILLHCLAGLGRTGTIAARLLVEAGVDARTAVDAVRAARPGAIQTRGQLDYVLRLGGER